MRKLTSRIAPAAAYARPRTSPTGGNGEPAPASHGARVPRKAGDSRLSRLRPSRAAGAS